MLQSEVPKGVQEQKRDGSGGENNVSGALRVALVCGGPSAERGISLNSARSVLDHLEVLKPFFMSSICEARRGED